MSKNCFDISFSNSVINSSLLQKYFDSNAGASSEQKARLLLVTDPICSTAWSFEGEIKRLLLEYGHAIELKVIMGGLLPSWSGFDRGGINKASDVFCHWKDVGDHYSVPVSAEVWKKDPLSSSFPASKAVICAFMQSELLGLKMLRRLREAVFLFDQNISKIDVLISKAEEIGLDIPKFMEDYDNHASSILEQEIQYSKDLNIKLLPTVLFTKEGQGTYMLEAKLEYSCLESALNKVLPDVNKEHYNTSLHSLMNRFESLSTKELSVLSQESWIITEQRMNQMKNLGLVELMEFSTGNYWIKKG